MKLFFSIVLMMSLGLRRAALGDNYDTLAAKGYRWVAIHGPYASTTEEGVARITNHHTSLTDAQMLADEDAYYLIPGKIVQIIKTDSATGMSQVHMGGLTSFLWTYSRFLRKRPIRNIYGTIETPEDSGLISNQSVTTADENDRLTERAGENGNQ
jgi:hypothetical protein